jgi:hypothetical protein
MCLFYITHAKLQSAFDGAKSKLILNDPGAGVISV